MHLGHGTVAGTTRRRVLVTDASEHHFLALPGRERLSAGSGGGASSPTIEGERALHRNSPAVMETTDKARHGYPATVEALPALARSGKSPMDQVNALAASALPVSNPARAESCRADVVSVAS